MESTPLAEDVPRRIDVYLSGGGYRAALGALGVFYFLVFDGQWPDVRRVVSVSGGSIVNAHLALTRPDASQITTELTGLFRAFTSRRRTVAAFALPSCVLILGVAAFLATWGVVAWWQWDWLTSRSRAETIAIALLVVAPLVVCSLLLVVPILLHFATKLWLRILCRGFVGSACLDDLAGSDWTVEHVFVATDLSEHGSVFFLANAIQPQVASLNRGYFDGRDVKFHETLRATTALPPLLPPTRLKLKPRPARPRPRRFSRVLFWRKVRVSRLPEREYLWKPERDRPSRSVEAAWLADGGVTGNLGIQLDVALTPDNPGILERILARTATGTPAARTPYWCTWHDGQVAWNCCACATERVIVDASGTSPAVSRLFERLLGWPLVGFPLSGIRSLQVMYESSLVDDHSHAGDVLVGVVRPQQLIRRLMEKNWPVPPTSNWAHRAMAVGKNDVRARHLAETGLRGMPDLLRACYAGRIAASKVKTRLSAVPAPVAARVVASGYLNACLNTHGPDAYAVADAGVRRLAELLGTEAALARWWDAVLDDRVGVQRAAEPPTGQQTSEGE